jgi:arylsulfatase A-like enzyme
LSTDWLDKRDKDKPFFLVVGEKATHREWFPDLQDLGAYDSVDFPLPETFYDDYDGRIAAGHQEMGIADIMRMDLDLKVDVDYDKDWPFTQLNAEQKAAYKAYYQDKISKEFHDLQLTGNALAEWKFQRYVRDYMSTANSLDRNIGKLLDYLDANGLAENTIVVYGSDQGFYLGEHGWFDKRFMYEESLRTPFVIRYPGVVKPGTVINQSVANIDWAPTFMEIAGVTVPNDIHGVSFLPILRDNEAVGRDAVYYHYYEYPQPHRVMSHFGVRTDRYKLVRFYGKQNFWELYDLREDPTEIHNLYGDVAYDSVITDLKGKLDQLIKTYKDTEAARVLAEK